MSTFTKKNTEILPKAPQTDAHRDCQMLLIEIDVQISRVRTARGARSPLTRGKRKKFVQKSPWTVATHRGKWLPATRSSWK